MYTQMPERFLIDGAAFEAWDDSLPLDPLLESRGIHPIPAAPELVRGYVGWWALRDGRLWLDRLTGLDDGAVEDAAGRPITLSRLFPDRAWPFFADWFTGRMTLRYGRRLRQVRASYGAVTEYERAFSFLGGHLVADVTHRLELAGDVVRREFVQDVGRKGSDGGRDRD